MQVEWLGTRLDSRIEAGAPSVTTIENFALERNDRIDKAARFYQRLASIWNVSLSGRGPSSNDRSIECPQRGSAHELIDL
jgi:hypothetical protein